MESLLLATGFAALAAASYTDIRTREVPDWLSYGAVAAGLGLRLVWSASAATWQPFMEGLVGFAAFFLVALALFYLGQWGGGDSKLLMGVGAILGVQPFPAAIVHGPLLAFLTNLLLVGALYGLLWSIALAAMHWPKVRRQLAAKRKGQRILRIAWLVALAAAAAAALTAPPILRVPLAGLALMLFLVGVAIVFVKAVENTCMLRWVSPTVLTEGDWIAKDVVVNGRVIAGPRDLGVSLAQIAKLKRLAKQKKVRQVLLKTGMPFIPCFLLAYVALLLAGNLAFLFL
jgi:Flp pilus assembly protein protease CpaA